MAYLILNEWVWADCKGTNGNERRSQTNRFLQAIFESADKVIIVKGSPFYKKAWNLCTAVDRPSRDIAKYFTRNYLYNSNKCLILAEQELTDITGTLSQSVKNDDHYLVKAAQTVPDSLIITTDNPLCKALNKFNIDCVMRDAYIPMYLL